MRGILDLLPIWVYFLQEAQNRGNKGCQAGHISQVGLLPDKIRDKSSHRYLFKWLKQSYGTLGVWGRKGLLTDSWDWLVFTKLILLLYKNSFSFPIRLRNSGLVWDLIMPTPISTVRFGVMEWFHELQPHLPSQTTTHL